ncbi:hypothetical protein DE146DRAFT_407957 [Phaeosphaeria sp. MPI-PUGE-AT-0046c]|nr:hypothetical protein DE146DRAFT_407957 [Phaeosphaeria sp. MPI-PUGE-AT-0046c]
MPIILPAVTKPPSPTTAWRCGSGRERVRLAADASMRCRARACIGLKYSGVKGTLCRKSSWHRVKSPRPPQLRLPKYDHHYHCSFHGHMPCPHKSRQCVSLPALFADSCALQRPGSQSGGPTCTSARCDLRSGCIGVHAAAMTWRLASQCRPHDRLALSGSMFDRRPSYAKLGLVHARPAYTTPVIALRPTTPARYSRSAKTPDSSIPCS